MMTVKTEKKTTASANKGLSRLIRTLKKYYGFYIMLLVPMVYLIIFKYVPMLGNVLAFRRYTARNPLFGSEWTGLYYFKEFIYSADFWKKFSNTLILSVETLIFTFPLPIIFALLLNELQNIKFKKLVQTASYLPHFISTVVVVGMISGVLSLDSGVINSIRKGMGLEAIGFMNLPSCFRPIYIISEIWQQLGWNAILYIAALAGINVELYDAAMVDGANRWQQTWAVTIPGIMPTIIITLIMAVGGIANVGFEKVLLLSNDLNRETADVVSTYVYRIGLASSAPNYSLSTAIGLFQAVIGLILVGVANFVANKLSDTSLW